MTNAQPLPRLSSQTRQGVTARAVSRIGSALRHAFAGLTHSRKPRRQAAPPRKASHPAAGTPNAPHRPRTPRRPQPAPPPAAPPRPGWIARWFGRARHAAPPRRKLLLEPNNTPGAPDFSPRTHPGLSQQACDLLNMPVGDCPPEVLRILLTALAHDIAEQLPPETGLADPQAMFAALWGRLGASLSPEAPDAPPPPQPDAASGPAGAMPQPPPPLPDAQAPAPAHSAAPVAAAPHPMPARAALPQPRPRHGRLSRRVRGSGLAPAPRRRPPLLPPPRRFCYAACAGPP